MNIPEVSLRDHCRRMLSEKGVEEIQDRLMQDQRTTDTFIRAVSDRPWVAQHADSSFKAANILAHPIWDSAERSRFLRIMVDAGLFRDMPQQGMELLRNACLEGDASLVAFLYSTLDPSVTDSEGNTTLHIICRDGNEAMVRQALSDIKKSNSYLLGIAKKLVSFGFNPMTLPNSQGFFPLQLGYRNPHLSQESYRQILGETGMIQHTGASAGSFDHLMDAISTGSKVGVTNYLTWSRTNVHMHNGSGRTPLMHAVLTGHLDIADLLLSRGAGIEVTNPLGETALLKAITLGDMRAVRYLVGRGANINAANFRGETALTLALKHEQMGIAHFLISNGAAFDHDMRNSAGESLFMAAVRTHHFELAELCLAFRPNIDGVDQAGDTALLLAAWKGDVEAVQFLLEKGANCGVRNALGETPIMVALKTDRLEVAEMLLPYIQSLDNNSDVLLDTLLLNAVEKGDVQVIEFLIGHSANVNARNSAGQTPLAIAIQNGQLSIAALLLEKGADIEVRDHIGNTPLMTAVYFGSPAAVQLLLHHGADFYTPENLVSLIDIAKARKNLEILDLLISARGFAVDGSNPSIVMKGSGASVTPGELQTGTVQLVKIAEAPVRYGLKIWEFIHDKEKIIELPNYVNIDAVVADVQRFVALSQICIGFAQACPFAKFQIINPLGVKFIPEIQISTHIAEITPQRVPLIGYEAVLESWERRLHRAHEWSERQFRRLQEGIGLTELAREKTVFLELPTDPETIALYLNADKVVVLWGDDSISLTLKQLDPITREEVSAEMMPDGRAPYLVLNDIAQYQPTLTTLQAWLSEGQRGFFGSLLRTSTIRDLQPMTVQLDGSPVQAVGLTLEYCGQTIQAVRANGRHYILFPPVYSQMVENPSDVVRALLACTDISMLNINTQALSKSGIPTAVPRAKPETTLNDLRNLLTRLSSPEIIARYHHSGYPAIMQLIDQIRTRASVLGTPSDPVLREAYYAKLENLLLVLVEKVVLMPEEEQLAFLAALDGSMEACTSSQYNVVHSMYIGMILRRAGGVEVTAEERVLGYLIDYKLKIIRELNTQYEHDQRLTGISISDPQHRYQFLMREIGPIVGVAGSEVNVQDPLAPTAIKSRINLMVDFMVRYTEPQLLEYFSNNPIEVESLQDAERIYGKLLLSWAETTNGFERLVRLMNLSPEEETGLAQFIGENGFFPPNIRDRIFTPENGHLSRDTTRLLLRAAGVLVR